MFHLQGDTSRPITFLMVTGSNGAQPWSGTVDLTLSKNGGAFVAPSGTLTYINNGWFKYVPASGDVDTYGDLVLHATGTGADPMDLRRQVVAFDPFDAALLGLTNVATETTAQGTSGTAVAIKAKTDLFAFTGNDVKATLDGEPVLVTGTLPVNVVQVSGTGVTGPDDLKADVSALSDVSGTAVGIKAKTDLLTFTGTSVRSDILSVNGSTVTGVSDFRATGFAVAGDQMNLADDAITLQKFDESTAFPLQSRDSGTALVARRGDGSHTLATISTSIAPLALEATLQAVSGTATGIKAKTDLFSFTGNDVKATLEGEAVVVSGTPGVNVQQVGGTVVAAPADLKADVSALALQSTQLTLTGTANAIKTKTDQLNFVGADVQATLDNETVALTGVPAVNVTQVSGSAVTGPSDFKADVSALATQASVDGVKAKTDLLSFNGGYVQADIRSVSGTLVSGPSDFYAFDPATDYVMADLRRLSGTALSGTTGLNLNSFFGNAGGATSKVVDDVGGGATGTGDWTATEKAQFRYRLGLDGSTSAPGATPVLPVDVTKIGGQALSGTLPTNFNSFFGNAGNNTVRIVDYVGATGTGGGASAADVWAYGSRSLTDAVEVSGTVPVNLIAVSGTAVTGPNDLKADTSTLATQAVLQQVSGTAVSIKAKTDLFSFAGTDVKATLDNETVLLSGVPGVNVQQVAGAPVSGVADFKADVSALADVSGTVVGIKAKTDLFSFGTQGVRADLMGVSGTAVTGTDAFKATGFAVAGDQMGLTSAALLALENHLVTGSDAKADTFGGLLRAGAAAGPLRQLSVVSGTGNTFYFLCYDAAGDLLNTATGTGYTAITEVN